MTNALFVTGTGTGVGKTVITGLLAGFFAKKGIKTITQKWIETGCKNVSENIRTPYMFKFPSSPHLAASLEKKNINTKKIKNCFKRLSSDFDFVIVEGTGGILVPINGKTLIVDIARDLDLPVLIVVENKLGAINQTLLTVEALRKRNLKIAGIIFNRLSKKENKIVLKDNVEIIEKLSGIKVLGELFYSKDKRRRYGNFAPMGERLMQILSFNI